jgi:2-isopropylmalate synthase
VNGVGSDTDIIIASAKAYIEALNLIYSGGIRQHPQVADV